MVQEKEVGMPQEDQFAQVFADFKAKVKARIEQVQRDAGYVDKAGEPSIEKVRETVLTVMTTECVVTSKTDRTKLAKTRGDWYFRIYPKGPGAGMTSIEELGSVDHAAYEKLADDVWDLTQSSRSGWVQKELGDKESTLVVCRRRIHRPTEAMLAAYVTDNERLIQEDCGDKLVISATKKARVVRREINMILERHPKLRGTLAAQLSGELAKIQAELTLPPASSPNGGAGNTEPAQTPAGV